MELVLLAALPLVLDPPLVTSPAAADLWRSRWSSRRFSRATVFYGAANRDERKYPDPDRFDVLRGPGDHLGFGAGPHACVRMNLARMEMLALFIALAKRIRRFTILDQEPHAARNPAVADRRAAHRQQLRIEIEKRLDGARDRLTLPDAIGDTSNAARFISS